MSVIDKLDKIFEGFADNKNFSNDTQMIRAAIQAEYDAISFYEQMSIKAENEITKELLLHIAEEEKVHIGELRELLTHYDDEVIDSEEKGKQEFKDLSIATRLNVYLAK